VKLHYHKERKKKTNSLIFEEMEKDRIYLVISKVETWIKIINHLFISVKSFKQFNMDKNISEADSKKY